MAACAVSSALATAVDNTVAPTSRAARAAAASPPATSEFDTLAAASAAAAETASRQFVGLGLDCVNGPCGCLGYCGGGVERGRGPCDARVSGGFGRLGRRVGRGLLGRDDGLRRDDVWIGNEPCRGGGNDGRRFDRHRYCATGRSR